MNKIKCQEHSHTEWRVHYHIDKRSVPFTSEKEVIEFVKEMYDKGYRHIGVEYKSDHYKRTLYGTE